MANNGDGLLFMASMHCLIQCWLQNNSVHPSAFFLWGFRWYKQNKTKQSIKVYIFMINKLLATYRRPCVFDWYTRDSASRMVTIAVSVILDCDDKETFLLVIIEDHGSNTALQNATIQAFIFKRGFAKYHGVMLMIQCILLRTKLL